MCIKNDANVGRILHCGICGIVACDEDCGPVMYECTGEFTTRSVSRGLGLGEVAPSFSEGPSGREGGGLRSSRPSRALTSRLLLAENVYRISAPLTYPVLFRTPLRLRPLSSRRKTTRNGTMLGASSAAPSRTSLRSPSSGTGPPPPPTGCPAPRASASGASRRPRRGYGTTTSAASSAAAAGSCRARSWSTSAGGSSAAARSTFCRRTDSWRSRGTSRGPSSGACSRWVPRFHSALHVLSAHFAFAYRASSRRAARCAAWRSAWPGTGPSRPADCCRRVRSSRRKGRTGSGRVETGYTSRGPPSTTSGPRTTRMFG